MILLDWLRRCRKSRSRKVRRSNTPFATHCEKARWAEFLEQRCMLSATIADSVVRSGSVTTNLRSAIDGKVDPSPPIPHTVLEGSDRLLVVSVMIEGNESVRSITYNSTPLTLAVKTDGGGGTESAVEIWYLVAPDVGTFDIAVDFDSITAPWAITATNFTGVDQFDPIGVVTGNSGSLGNVAVDITTSGGSLIFGAAAKDSELASFTPGAAEITERIHDTGDRAAEVTADIQADRP